MVLGAVAAWVPVKWPQVAKSCQFRPGRGRQLSAELPSEVCSGN